MIENDLLEQMRAVLAQLDQQGEQQSQEGTPEGNTQQARTVINVFFVDEPTTEEEPVGTVESSLTARKSPPPPLQPSARPVKPASKRAKGNALFSLAVFCICLLISLALMFLFIIPSFFPIATVTIIPLSHTLVATGTLQVPVRALPQLTLSQSKQVRASGHRHQDAAQAEGELTFYNGLFTSQTIEAGIVLTGVDGVQIATDEPAIIPAANPPYIGQVTVTAHALNPGKAGNIEAQDVNQTCCLTGVKAINTSSFQGGQNARDFIVVTKRDIDAAAATLRNDLIKSERAALNAQLTPGEELLIPPYQPSTTANHQAGEEATHVTVTVSETCSGLAYKADALHALTTQMLTSHAITKLGENYALMGAIHVSLINRAIMNVQQGQASILVQIAGTYVYQISPGEKKQLVKLIAGKSKQQAVSILFSAPGIQAAAIQLSGGNTTLPQDPAHIHITIVYAAG